jgi:hypothetical protein
MRSAMRLFERNAEARESQQQRQQIASVLEQMRRGIDASIHFIDTGMATAHTTDNTSATAARAICITIATDTDNSTGMAPAGAHTRVDCTLRGRSHEVIHKALCNALRQPRHIADELRELIDFR